MIDEIGEPAHRSIYFRRTNYPIATVFYKEAGCKLNLLSTLQYSERVVLQVRGMEKNSFLFLNQRTIKNGSKIKACLIGPPEAQAVFALFLDWEVKQQMNSALLVFDLVRRNAGFERERIVRGFIYPKSDDGEKTVGFISGE